MIRHYDKMKDSGISWVRDIPEEWIVFPIGGVFHEVKELNIDNVYGNAFSFKYGEIVDKKIIGGVNKKVSETLSSYTIVSPNTIMINGLNLNYDFISQRVAMVNEKGIITSAYLAIQPDEKKIFPKYVLYLLKSYDNDQVFHGLGSGVRKTLKYDDLKHIKIIAPKMEIQIQIAKYLDFCCSSIDSIIAEAKLTIDDYKDLKQSIITKAVTKGLNPDVTMKDSGVEWIGKIPKCAHLSQVNKHFEIILGKMLCNRQLDKSYSLESYYCAADVHFDGISTHKLKKMWFNTEEKRKYLVQNGDLLVVEGGAGAGGCYIAKNQHEHTYIQNSIMIVRPKKNADIRFLRYLIESLVKQGYIEFVCNKATIPHFTKDKLNEVPFVCFNEHLQSEIATYLDSKCADIDSIITEKKAIISELETYKKSLIYEVVTGKRKVV